MLTTVWAFNESYCFCWWRVWNNMGIAKMWHRDHGVNKCSWRNGTHRAARHQRATHFRCVKKCNIFEMQSAIKQCVPVVAAQMLTVCNIMDHSTPGFPVLHHLLKLAHPTIPSSVIPFSSCLQSCPVSGSFLIRKLFTARDKSIGVSTSASVLPVNIQNWFPLGLTSWISLQAKGLSRVFSSTTVQKHSFFSTQPSLWPNAHIHIWLLEKP